MEQKINENNVHASETNIKTSTVVQNQNIDNKDALAIVEDRRKQDFKEIAENEDFLKASKQVNAREVATLLRKKDNQIKNEELNRELEEYILKKEKEKIDYTKKLEKGLIKKEIEADINDKKRLIAERRYGYLYDQEISNGRIIYKDFTQSKTINRLKEISNWYKGLGDNIQKMISTTVKFILKAGVSIGGLYVVYQILKFINNLGIGGI